MGTRHQDGKKPKNRITVSKSGENPPRQIDPDTGTVDRSFAQPNPSIPPREIEPKAHANAKDEIEALNKNSTESRTYSPDGDEDSVKDAE